MLWLVRHAAVEVDTAVPPHEWRLTTEGRAAAGELAARLPSVARVVSSDEPKAVATAEPIARAKGIELALDQRLREVRRDRALPDYETHRAAVRSYLAGEPVDGWELREPALARIRAAVEGLDDAAVVTHATVLALLLGWSFERWEELRLPDVVEWQP